MQVGVVLAAAVLTVPAVAGCSHSASGCGTAKQQALAYLQAGLAMASPRPNPDYGKSYPGVTQSEQVIGSFTANPGVTFPATTETNPTLPGNAQAAAQQLVLASYVIVQHPTCFTDAELAGAQQRIDQSKQ